MEHYEKNGTCFRALRVAHCITSNGFSHPSIYTWNNGRTGFRRLRERRHGVYG